MDNKYFIIDWINSMNGYTNNHNENVLIESKIEQAIELLREALEVAIDIEGD